MCLRNFKIGDVALDFGYLSSKVYRIWVAVRGLYDAFRRTADFVSFFRAAVGLSSSVRIGLK